jgi:hypothetical protein
MHASRGAPNLELQGIWGDLTSQNISHTSSNDPIKDLQISAPHLEKKLQK